MIQSFILEISFDIIATVIILFHREKVGNKLANVPRMLLPGILIA